ncbi:glycosyl transferase family 1 [Gordonia spumicola]|uniref:Glycosyl transferase family 1 n=1 Tax=Gordonia spumicola TaxID=589161 RepID=A0A7I9V573_9ACTN|nr:glycosyltransferase family 4 protein [Gordonia spumicola]GEE00343.1 glycosyl transferase family 1 [Gordonia spumicola]
MSVSRVVFVSHTRSFSGAEAVMLNLVAEAVDRGLRVLVACPAGAVADKLPSNVEHVELPSLGLSGGRGVGRAAAVARLASQWRRAGRILAAFDDDSTRIVVNSLPALPAVRFGRLRGTATWLVHDTVADRKQRLYVRIGSGALRRAVAVSDATAEPLRTSGFPVVVRVNGVRVDVDAAPLEHPGTPVIGILAALTEWKGHVPLLEAIAQVDDVRLEIAGEGFPGDEEHVERLRALAERPGLAGRVSFLGRADAGECLRRWTATVSASIRPEAGPLGVLEALAVGCPVIGTDHGGTADYLAAGCGLLVAPSDPQALASAVRRVVADPTLRADLAARGRARVRSRHDIDHTIPATLSALLG